MSERKHFYEKWIEYCDEKDMGTNQGGTIMRKILISIRPEWLAKILNGEKAIEIRKTKPNCEMPCEVYIYCTKGKPNLYRHFKGEFFHSRETRKECLWNGKVVAKFTMRETQFVDVDFWWPPAFMFYDERGCAFFKEDALKLMGDACMNGKDIYKYLGKKSGVVHALHIEGLKIFDTPKNLADFGLKKAPQSWCYIKEEEK